MTEEEEGGRDPRQWGQYYWFVWHTDAANYPKRPTPEDRAATRAFVQLFLSRLPCANCRREAGILYATNPLLDSDLDNADAYSRYVWAFHDAVNARLEKRRRPDYEQVRRWFDIPAAPPANSLAPFVQKNQVAVPLAPVAAPRQRSVAPEQIAIVPNLPNFSPKASQALVVAPKSRIPAHPTAVPAASQRAVAVRIRGTPALAAQTTTRPVTVVLRPALPAPPRRVLDSVPSSPQTRPQAGRTVAAQPRVSASRPTAPSNGSQEALKRALLSLAQSKPLLPTVSPTALSQPRRNVQVAQSARPANASPFVSEGSVLSLRSTTKTRAQEKLAAISALPTTTPSLFARTSRTSKIGTNG